MWTAWTVQDHFLCFRCWSAHKAIHPYSVSLRRTQQTLAARINLYSLEGFFVVTLVIFTISVNSCCLNSSLSPGFPEGTVHEVGHKAQRIGVNTEEKKDSCVNLMCSQDTANSFQKNHKVGHVTCVSLGAVKHATQDISFIGGEIWKCSNNSENVKHIMSCKFKLFSAQQQFAIQISHCKCSDGIQWANINPHLIMK